MTRMKRTLIALALPLAAAACEPPTPPVPPDDVDDDACPLSPQARTLLTETVDQLFVNSSFALLNTHGGFAPDLAYGASLVGLDDKVLQSATLAVPCTEPTTFDPTCETNLLPEGEPPPSAFFAEHDRCFRLGCSGDGAFFVDSYFVMKPNTLPEPRHVFTLSLSAPEGAVSTYEQNPVVRWNSDLTEEDVTVLAADIDVAHVVTLADDTTVNLSHSGTVSGRHVFDAEVTLDIALAFDAGAVVEVHGLADDTVAGFIRVDGEDVATLAAPIDLGAPLPFVWRAGCE
jgi:hypothetical protein